MGRQVSELFSASPNKAKYFDCGDAATAAHRKHSQKHTAEHTGELMDTRSACSLLPRSEESTDTLNINHEYIVMFSAQKMF